MHKLLNKYLFLFDVGGLLYVMIELSLAWSQSLDHVYPGRSVFYLSGTDQRGIALGDTTVAADPGSEQQELRPWSF